MLVYRTFDADKVNKIVNHPEVLPWVVLDGEHKLDVTELISNKANKFYLGDGFCFVFRWVSSGTYEGHTMAVPSVRGKTVINGGKKALKDMFENGCGLIFGWTPIDNKPANSFNRLVGFKKRFTKKIEQIPGMVPEKMNYWEFTNGN